MNIFNNWYRIIIIIILIILLYYSGLLFSDREMSQGDVVVFILDTRVDRDYLEAEPAAINKNTSHGSLVAWIINKETSDIRIRTLTVSDPGGKIWDKRYLASLKEVLEYKKFHPGKRVIVNISLGFPERELQREYIHNLYKEGVLIVAAAGNNNSEIPVYPAGFKKEVVAVTSADREGKDDYSNYGQFIDLAAPGSIQYIERLYFPGQNLNRVFKFGGTSFAAPRVTALLARVINLKPELRNEEAISLLKKTALPIDDRLYKNDKLGAGVINIDGVLTEINDTYKREKISKILLVILLGYILISIFWSKYGVFSIFIIIMILLLGLPFFPLIKGSLSDLQNRIVYLPVVVIIIYLLERFIILLIPYLSNIRVLTFLTRLPSEGVKQRVEQRLTIICKKEDKSKIISLLLATDSIKVSKILINVLTELQNPPVDFLYNYALQKKRTQGHVIERIRNINDSKLVLDEVKKYLYRGKSTTGRVVREILIGLKPGVVLPEIKKLLDDDRINIQLLLEIIEGFGTEAGGLRERVLGVLKNSPDMWVRYQALRTLAFIMKDREALKKLANNYINDRHQLVRMEAEAIIKKEDKIFD